MIEVHELCLLVLEMRMSEDGCGCNSINGKRRVRIFASDEFVEVAQQQFLTGSLTTCLPLKQPGNF